MSYKYRVTASTHIWMSHVTYINESCHIYEHLVSVSKTFSRFLALYHNRAFLTHTHTHTHTHTCTHRGSCWWACGITHLSRTHICTRTQTHAHTYAHTHIRTHIHTHTHTYIYTHTHMHTCTHTHTHTHNTQHTTQHTRHTHTIKYTHTHSLQPSAASPVCWY